MTLARKHIFDQDSAEKHDNGQGNKEKR